MYNINLILIELESITESSYTTKLLIKLFIEQRKDISHYLFWVS